MQSAISPVTAGSTFAILQSAAMGGYGLSTVIHLIQMVGGAGLVIAACWKSFFGGGDGGDDDKVKVT